uniref:Uncharacterized protein n=1 Tax=Arundo donax TaxID=35708 RepID=A0A0A9FPV5_ARUDO
MLCNLRICLKYSYRNITLAHWSALWLPGNNVLAMQSFVFNHRISKEFSKSFCCSHST